MAPVIELERIARDDCARNHRGFLFAMAYGSDEPSQLQVWVSNTEHVTICSLFNSDGHGHWGLSSLRAKGPTRLFLPREKTC